ncbi:MAG: AAA family ATPase [Rhodobacteraceae bacterium]|nr:AAA family ATPase [Paracoccaceae bacterium]
MDPDAITSELTAQAALFTALAASRALGDAPVERIDTPLSAIFLCGDRAYKAMRAVTRRFVDFSHLEHRRAACEAELNANPAAPGLYLRVVPVLQSDQGLMLGGAEDTANALEWLVVMRRFDHADAFDQRLADGRLTRVDIEQLADAAGAAHIAAPVLHREDAGADMAVTINNLTAALGALSNDAPSTTQTEFTSALSAWRPAISDALAMARPQLKARGRHGRVRRCHGDLHLANVCRFEGRATPFDAIAFNDDLTRIDIAYDAAFCAMDLAARGVQPLASAFISRWLSMTRDYSGLALWPLFLSTRAAVRAMVAGFAKDWETAIARLASANRFLCFSPPLLLAIGGASGAGKTTLARQLTPEIPGLGGLGAVHMRSDVARKRLLGLPPEQRAPQSAYAPEVSARMLRQMLRDAGRALRAGESVVWDATFILQSDRDALSSLAAASGTDHLGLWLDAPPALRAARAERRTQAAAQGEPPDASDAGAGIALRQQADPLTDPHWRRIASDTASDHIAAEARQILIMFPFEKQI